MPDSNSLNTPDTSFPILARIDSPEDLRDIDEEQLPQLAEELHQQALQALSIFAEEADVFRYISAWFVQRKH